MGGNVHCSFLIRTKVSKGKILDAAMQCLQSQWWWHMSKAFTPPFLPPFSLSAPFLSILQWTALELEWSEQDRQLPGPCAPERGQEGRRGCTDFNEMHSVNGHSLWRGQEEKGALFFSPLPSPLCPFLPSLCISCPPPQLARGFVRRQMIPQMPQPSRPFLATFTSLPSGQRSPPGIWMGLRGNSGHGGWESGRGFLLLTGYGQCWINLIQTLWGKLKYDLGHEKQTNKQTKSHCFAAKASLFLFNVEICLGRSS